MSAINASAKPYLHFAQALQQPVILSHLSRTAKNNGGKGIIAAMSKT